MQTFDESREKNCYGEGIKDMKFGKGIIFLLTKEDIVSLAKESDIAEEVIDDRFLKEISDGMSLLTRTQVKKFFREIRR